MNLNPNKYTYVVHEGDKVVLYAKLDKLLYGPLRAALLFWENLSSTLES
jgi:hypothetical protein